MRTAVYAGSFDPPTVGHECMIATAARLFDTLVVAVGVNSAKKPMFTVDERLAFMTAIVGQHPNVFVDSFTDQYLVNYADKIGAQTIIRGLRNVNDYVQEQAMMQENRLIKPSIQTVFLIADPEFASVSSSVVKSLIGPHGWEEQVKQRLPYAIQDRVVTMITNQKDTHVL